MGFVSFHFGNKKRGPALEAKEKKELGRTQKPNVGGWGVRKGRRQGEIKGLTMKPGGGGLLGPTGGINSVKGHGKKGENTDGSRPVMRRGRFKDFHNIFSRQSQWAATDTGRRGGNVGWGGRLKGEREEEGRLGKLKERRGHGPINIRRRLNCDSRRGNQNLSSNYRK